MATSIDEYIETREWKTPKDVSTNFTSIIRDIERRAGSRISPAKPSTINAKLASEIPDETIVKTRLSLVNRNKESIIRVMELDDLNIDALIDIKYKLLADDEDISEVVNKNLNIKSYYNFLANPSLAIDTFRFNLESLQGGLPKDTSVFDNFIREIITELSKKDRTFMATAKIESIKESLHSATTWKYPDLSMHAIGSFDDLISMTMILLREEGKALAVSREPRLADYFKRIFEPYFAGSAADMNAFINSINIDPFSPALYDYCYLDGALNPPFKSSRSVVGIAGLTMKHIIDGLSKIAGYTSTDIQPIGEVYEGVVVELYMIFFHAMMQWRRIAERFAEFQRDTYGDKYNYVRGRIEDACTAYDKIIKTALAKYFVFKDTTNYGFMEGNTDKIPKEALLAPVKRLIGGYENIGDINKLRADYFPIKITVSGIPAKFSITAANMRDISKLMRESVIYKIDRDLVENAPIYFGGFVLEDYTARTSIRILHDYYSKISTLKRRNILMINKIQEFMKTSLHVKQITAIIEQLKLEIEKIKGVSGTSADKVAKTMVDTISETYGTLKKDEMQNLLEWNDMLKTYKNTPEAFDRKYSDILKKREIIITKVYFEKNNAQLIKLIFGKLYDRIKATALPASARVNFSEEYKTWMMKKFAEIDTKLISEMKTKTEDSFIISSFETNRGLEKAEKAAAENGADAEVSLSLSITDLGGAALRTVVQWKKLWSDFLGKLGGYNIYIPYYKTELFGSLFGGGRYGLFNWSEAGKDTEVKESGVYKLSDTVIPGSALDRAFVGKSVVQKLIGNGYIVVANNTAELDRPDRWRCVNYDEIVKLKAIDTSTMGGVEAFYKGLFNMIASKDSYQDRAKFIMEDSAFRKKIVDICQSSVKKTLKECNMLVSRNKVADKLSGLPDLAVS